MIYKYWKQNKTIFFNVWSLWDEKLSKPIYKYLKQNKTKL